MGNILSIKNMIRHVGGEAQIISKPVELEGVDKIILPGVGAFDNGMQKLREKDFVEVLNTLVLGEKKPVLGICLGMQLMTQRSAEGELPGLSWFEAETYKMQEKINGTQLRIPHMGWNTVTFVKDSAISLDMEESPRFYFVHGYAVRCFRHEDILCQCEYGEDITAGMMRENIYGVQFHPEKSHKFGMKLLENFINLKI
jgi:glutamine amidotransferase